MNKNQPEILSAIVGTGKLEKDTDEALGAAIKEFRERFVREHADAAAA